jgi:hypothetical protein
MAKPRTMLSLEGNKKNTITLVVSAGDQTIRHELVVNEMQGVAMMLVGRLGELAKRRR